MNKTVRQLIARMSLRAPQARALEILADVLERIALRKDADTAAQLAVVHAAYPSVDDFERDFASLCFALATGVGKTRLMGAFIAYLYLTGRSRHFFVLAPNLTIYEKLKSDFDPASPKYVFKGVAEFATDPPVIVTGENYESGRGVRRDSIEPMTVAGHLFAADDAVAHINIFNISKFNGEMRGGNAPRMKQLQEYIGDSYFGYLAARDDLVLLMDEAHRYRASAGIKAIAELQPVLGLELTATPKTVGAKSQPFKNVAYAYGLAEALADGLVKEPAVATRKDFDPSTVPDDELERIKLEDGIHHHEFVKVELETFAARSGLDRKKPFMLVVAQDTAHASRIRQFMESDAFFEGAYQGRVIEVHSAQKGEESEEATARLLAVEHDATTEVVIHVNKLKEGWDVSNLYTIVPLRASASEILTEQTLGRGLRLPYGRRVGVAAIDRLTIVAHDRFQEIIDRAGRNDSVIRQRLYIGDGGDVPAAAPVSMESLPVGYTMVVPSTRSVFDNAVGSSVREQLAEHSLESPGDREIVAATFDSMRRQEHLAAASDLNDPRVRSRIADDVRLQLGHVQIVLPGISDATDRDAAIERIVERVTADVARLTIEVPQIVVVPTREVSFGYADFDLDGLDRIRYQPVSEELLIQHLHDNGRESIGWKGSAAAEPRLENYVVRALMERDEIDYDVHSALLYKLAGQIVGRLRSYLADEAAVTNVLLYYQRQLSEFVWSQMQRHSWETPTGYRGRVTRGFSVLQPYRFSLPPGQRPLNFREPLNAGTNIRQVAFAGFRKCCYDLQQFHSAEGEQRLAMVLEDDTNVLRWMKPGPRQFQIDWKHGKAYEPDFVVETLTEKLLLEPKRQNEVDDPDVRQKAQAAARWCGFANGHAREHGAKQWRYALIPHDAIRLGATARGLADAYEVTYRADS